MEEDIKVLENMRDNIYGAIQFEDDYQVRILEQKEFDALNLAINHLKKTKLVHSQFIPKSKVKEKIEILEKCTTKIDKKVNLTDYMIIGETERAIGRFVNLDFIKKVLLDEPGYNIELIEEGE